MRHVVGISGGAILGDGKVALIVDVKGVVNLHEGSRK
jgi:two-component system chemotaxis sensor kinase CheA